ncbi:MAG: hypothetical protein J0I43_08580 [Microbacterium sp.]|uniref:hypothetical protein n=1 Tax=Microbacterium sp. TaxID=51671 RepID=UPI001AD47756|nr:hypothetical protein [Microbacterium sp.]MBN9177403.1 hypothetical protein [Microbacterium sp.]
MSSPERPAFRSRRPRVTATVSVIVAAGAVALGAALLWAGARDGAFVGPAAAMLVLGVLSALLGIVGYRVARAAGASAMTGPIRLFTILSFVVGVAGAVLGIVFGGLLGSVPAIGAGCLALLLSLVVSLQGALLYGAAAHRD